MADIPQITIAELIDRYEVLLFDAYGVLVHSTGALPGAAELIRRLNRTGKPYFVLTNDASRLPATAAGRYRGYGLNVGVKQLITAGMLLKGYFAEQGLAGKRCVVLGPSDSRRYVEQAGGRVVATEEPFEVLVIADEAGFPFLESVDIIFSSLCRALDRENRVHLVLPNPDLIYPKADGGYGFAAGSVARMFEGALQLRYPRRAGLRFARLGKPHAGLFAEALARSGRRNMVMIGDQLETDIRGARAFGLDAVWVGSGVTGPIGEDLCPDIRPSYVMASVAAESGLSRR
jgi:HAD superfamily hydrolase (TIGR01450 family)